MNENESYIIQVLKDVGLVDDSQIKQAEAAATRESKDVVDALVDEGVVSRMNVLKAVGMKLGMDVIDLEDHDIPRDVIDQMPADTARRYRVIPVSSTDHALTVALSDPLDIETLDSLRYLLKRNVEGVIASKEGISTALDHYYGRQEKTLDEIFARDDGADVGISADSEDDQETESDAPIIRLVSLIILEAQRNRASDIHIEPVAKRLRVRYRIDGVLHEVENPPKRLQPVIISRIKLMAGMKLAEKRVPQDGRIQINVGGEELDLRVSAIPASHGESIVMRILSKKSLALGLPKLGFFADDQQTFERLIGLPDGIILITGPTGSGKTTTLYAVLSHLNLPNRKIITVEDPVEYQISGINQVHVREDIGLTFPMVLRSILRQAPNIIMVGEIRDFDTAEIAINASLTGHMVLSTLHTNDAPSAITRLLDIGVQPFLLASSIRATMAQRLVRMICDQCKEKYSPDASMLETIGKATEDLSSAQLYRGRGCRNCAQTGYRERRGIFEIFVMDDEIRNMIYSKVSAAELRQRAVANGMRTLREDGLRKVVSGMTTLEEVLAVTMGE